MKKSKITKEEWDRDKQNLTDDILNKYNIYDFMNCLVEFELPEFDLSYKTKEEDCGVPIQVGIIPRIAASCMGKNFG